MSWKKIIEILNLQPLPHEGGFYRETYRADTSAFCSEVAFNKNKSYSTAIYYLVTSKSFSALHRVKQDEVFHFYAGSPVEMFLLFDDGKHDLVSIGSDIFSGQKPQVLAPKNVWQGTRLKDSSEDSWALLGTTVAPAFEFEDFELASRSTLQKSFPDLELLINRYTLPDHK